MKNLQLAGDLMTALARVPDGYYVTLEKERSEDEDGRLFLSASLFERAPEDGWQSRGARFHAPPGSPSYKEPAAPYAHDDAVIFSVTADIEQPEALERLLIAALTKRFP